MRELFVLGLFFVLLPVILGCLLENEQEISIQYVWPMGFFTECAIFECLCVPMTIIGATFSTLVKIFLVVLFVVIVAIISKRRNVICALIHKKNNKNIYNNFAFLILLLIIIIQTFIPAFMTEYGSWDDSSYIVTSLDTIKSNTLWRTSPYTGEYMLMPSKRILTSWSIYNAFLAYLSGVSPTTIYHFIEPFIFLPMMYSAIIYIADGLFEKNKEKIEFAIIVGILLMYGFRANSAMERWILVYPWSGRSILFGIIIPFTIAYIMRQLRNEFTTKSAIGIGILNIAACSFTTMSIGMMSILFFVILISYSISERRFVSKYQMKNILLSVSPQIIFLIIYILWRGDNGYS